MINSYNELEQSLHEFAKLSSELAEKEAQMNQELETIKANFAASVKQLKVCKDGLEKDIQAYCIENKSDFEKTRSKEFTHASVGFKINPPKVNLLNRKFSVATALELVKKVFKNKFVRTKEELDKESIIAAYSAGEIKDEKLAAVGLRIDQDETFYINVKWENL